MKERARVHDSHCNGEGNRPGGEGAGTVLERSGVGVVERVASECSKCIAGRGS